MTFGARLQELMDARGISQSELARRLGLTSQAVSQWANARVAPRGRRLEAIADALGVAGPDLHAPVGAPIPEFAAEERVVDPPRETFALMAEPDHKLEVGRRLQTVLRLLGMDESKAAHVMGVPSDRLHGWITGNEYPDPYAIYRLNRARGVTYDYLFLEDWSGLPHRLGKALDAEFQATLAGASAAEPTDAGTV